VVGDSSSSAMESSPSRNFTPVRASPDGGVASYAPDGGRRGRSSARLDGVRLIRVFIRFGTVSTRVALVLPLKLVAVASRRYRLCLEAVLAERFRLVRAACHHRVEPRVRRPCGSADV